MLTADERGRMTNTNRTGPTTRPPLSHGAAAPEIVLPMGKGQTWASCDFRGEPIVVVFYPADWEPVSTDQLRSHLVSPGVRAGPGVADGMSARARFVIDGDGVMRWRYLAHHEVNPGIDGMLTALEALATHEGAGRGQSIR